MVRLTVSYQNEYYFAPEDSDSTDGMQRHLCNGGHVFSTFIFIKILYSVIRSVLSSVRPFVRYVGKGKNNDPSYLKRIDQL